jgi:quercetin dioxygenase-like cupin family protein
MSYKVTRTTETVIYNPPGHFDMKATRLHSAGDVGGNITLGLSHFLPGGGAEMAEAPIELLYYIIEGEMTVGTPDGKKHVLHTGDSIHFSPHQGRESTNTGHSSAKMLVLSCPEKQ